MDQCTHCTLKGNLEECEKVECGHHELWYVSALKAKEHFNNNTQQVQPKIAQQIMLSYKELFGNDFNSAANLAAHVVARLSDMH